MRSLAASIPALFALAGCGSSDDTPSWAFDPFYLEPAGVGDVFGLQTWNVYSDPWSDNRDERYFLCAVVAQLEGGPTPTCETCDVAWEVVSTFVESDCPGSLAEDPLFTSVVGVGFAAGSPSGDAPYPELSGVGFVDYGFGWEVHGDAWPEALDSGGTAESAEWDDAQPFTFWPTAIWPLADTAADPATATPVSRFADDHTGPRG